MISFLQLTPAIAARLYAGRRYYRAWPPLTDAELSDGMKRALCNIFLNWVYPNG